MPQRAVGEWSIWTTFLGINKRNSPRRFSRKLEGENCIAACVRNLHFPAIAGPKRAIRLAQLFAAGYGGFLPSSVVINEFQPLIYKGTRFGFRPTAEIEKIERHAFRVTDRAEIVSSVPDKELLSLAADAGDFGT